jgi:hypothetical protein
MPSLVLCTGFEHTLNLRESWIKGNTGLKYADAIDGTGPQILSSGGVRSGTGMYRFQLAAQAARIIYGARIGRREVRQSWRPSVQGMSRPRAAPASFASTRSSTTGTAAPRDAQQSV